MVERRAERRKNCSDKDCNVVVPEELSGIFPVVLQTAEYHDLYSFGLVSLHLVYTDVRLKIFFAVVRLEKSSFIFWHICHQFFGYTDDFLSFHLKSESY